MPSSITRWGEKLRQKLSPQESSNEWRPTSNARNQSMIEETRAFAQHVKLLLRELDDTNDGLMARVEASLATMGTVLTASPPRAFDETGAPVNSGEQIGGVAVNHAALVSAGQEMRQRLTDEVILPLQQWLEAFRGIKARNKKVEEVRLDLDTKRREMMQLQERYTKLQSQGHKDSDDLQYKAKCREFKLGYLAAHYRELEAEVSNALLDLNSDTAMLRNYQAAAIAIMQRCFTTAHAAFNPNVPESVCRRSNAVGAMGAMPCANLHVSTSKFKDAKENADREGQDNNSGSVDATDSLDRAASTVCVQGSEREEYSSAPIPRPLCPAPAAPAAAAVEELGKKKGLKGFGRFSLGFLKMSKQGDAATTEGAGAFVAADPCEDEAGGLGDFAQGFEDAAEGFRDLAGGLENAAEGFGGLAEGLEDAAEGFGDLAEGFRDAAEGFADVAEGLEDAAEGLEDAAEGLEDAAEGFGGLAEGFNSLVQGEEKE